MIAVSLGVELILDRCKLNILINESFNNRRNGGFKHGCCQ